MASQPTRATISAAITAYKNAPREGKAQARALVLAQAGQFLLTLERSERAGFSAEIDQLLSELG